MHWPNWPSIALLVALVHLLGAVNAVHATFNARSSQGAVAWVMALAFFPWVALPCYWVFGRREFHGYIEALRAASLDEGHAGVREMMHAIAEHAVGVHQKGSPDAVFEELAGQPFTRGNHSTLLVDGQATFDAIFSAIAAAEHYVLVQFFIIKDDQLGRAFQARLLEKAAQGVRVYLLYDEMGSRGLPRHYLAALRKAGVAVSSFGTTRGFRNRFQINFRNHRKIVVVDGHTAFVGGHNVGDEYMGRSERFGPWRDTHMRVVGPCVKSVQMTWLGDWYWATRSAPDLRWSAEPAKGVSQDVLAMATGPTDTVRSCALFFVHAIHRARRRVWIASPYFVPDGAVSAALQVAALRGVDVRILLPKKPDHRLVYLASFAYLKLLDMPGIRFYRYVPGFMHQKVLLVDGDFACVGTANADNRSFHLNFELTMIVANKMFAAELEKVLDADLERSIEVGHEDYRRRSFLFKVAVSGARLMSPVL